MPIITEMYAFCAQESPGDEGIIGFVGPDQNWVPLVGADMTRVEQLRDIALQIGAGTNMQVTLKKFKLVSEEAI